MEENTVELSDFLDYLRVIWKRKIIIIAVTLVCIGVGAGVGVTKTDSGTKLPATYCAVAIVKIGKKVKLVPTTGIQPTVGYIESLGDLEKTFPLTYGYKVKNFPGYHLDAEQVGELAMLELTMKGPDSGVERVLKEIVDMLVESHNKKAERSVTIYKEFIKATETDTETLRQEILVIDSSIKGMKRKEADYMLKILPHGTEETTGNVVSGDRSAFLNMLYLKTIDMERELSYTRANLRSMQMQLTVQRLTIGNLEEYKTELVGEVKSTVVKPKEEEDESWMHEPIAVGGVAGLIMSLFIVFLMEYIEESKSRRKGK